MFYIKTLAQWTNIRGWKKKKAKRLLLPPGGLWGNVTEKAEQRGPLSLHFVPKGQLSTQHP